MIKIIYIIQNDYAIQLLSYSTTFQLLLRGRSGFPKGLIFSTFKLMHIYKRENQEQRTLYSVFALVASAMLNHPDLWKSLHLRFLTVINLNSPTSFTWYLASRFLVLKKNSTLCCFQFRACTTSYRTVPNPQEFCHPATKTVFNRLATLRWFHMVKAVNPMDVSPFLHLFCLKLVP